MTIQQANEYLQADLAKVYNIREANKITDLVLTRITGFSRTDRLIRKTSPLTKQQYNLLYRFKGQLIELRPVQYVLQEAWFFGMPFYVDENVLIPRPETEELVDLVITQANGSTAIIDIGTGSGCIAISLKKKLPATNVYALDISSKAIAVAKKNALKNDTEIEFFQQNILGEKAGTIYPVFDIIVSNPPYIRRSEARAMFSNVLLYEPHNALFVPDKDPLVFYRSIADFGLKHLNISNGRIYVEINEELGNEVTALFMEKGYKNVLVKKDMQNKDRIVYADLN